MKIKASERLDSLELEDVPRWASIILKELKTAVNGNLSFQDNFDAELINIEFAAANTDTKVVTRLRRKPINYIVTKRDAVITVYDGQKESETGIIYLRASAVGNVGLLVF